MWIRRLGQPHPFQRQPSGRPRRRASAIWPSSPRSTCAD